MQLKTAFCAVLCLSGWTPLQAAEAVDLQQQWKYFEAEVRPLMAKRCFRCHGEQKQNGKLRLDSRAGVLTGGESGAALVPGNPEQSLLMSAVRYESLEMPPDRRLSAAEVEVFRKWIALGAAWPGQDSDTGSVAIRSGEAITDQDRNYWAYQPIVRPAVPKFDASPGVNPIDAFVVARLKQHGLQSAPPADRRELLRRLHIDLLGLPPSPEEVRAFLRDQAPDAYARRVDELMARSQYGERWGRHWLDVVRFSQTNGYERDDEKPMAWRYRDYVIRAFNQDRPFNQFVREQIAGDEMDTVTADSLDATGFYRLGVWDDEPDDSRQAEFDGLDDMLSTIGSSFLGMTIGCARCHEHKFDPIPHADYYRLLAFVRNVQGYSRDGVLLDLPNGRGQTLAVREHGREAKPTHVLIRGDAGTLGEEVQPSFLQVLATTSAGSPTRLLTPPDDAKSSYRRRALADWISDSANPLTARVIANRVWHYHFGSGIVPTPNNFGRSGLPPSHPELLDYLATELVQHGWSIKHLHRLILMSYTYRQSSHMDSRHAVKIDPDNRLLWRQNLRRLEAEAVRDSMLAVSGELNLEAGGRGIFPNVPAEAIAGQSKPGRGWEASGHEQRVRRSVYIFSKRGVPIPLMELFDRPSSEKSTDRRSATTIAPQALTLLNSQFSESVAAAFAARLLREHPDGDAQAITRGYELALGRAPTEGEMATATGYIKRQESAFAKQPAYLAFKPNLPSALFDSLYKRAAGADYYRGPTQGWTYARGHWPDKGDGIRWIDPAEGPFALWTDLPFRDGSVRGKFRLSRNLDVVSFYLRGRVQDHRIRGYEFSIDPANETATVLHHGEQGLRVLASVQLPSAKDREVAMQIAAQGSQIRVRLDDTEITLVDGDADEAFGSAGLRVWGGALVLSELSVQGAGQQADLIALSADRDAPRSRAMQVFCNLLLNLNEFVYID